MLQIESPTPPPWRKTEDTYLAMRNGYLCFHFFKLDDQKNVLISSRKTFVMTPKNIDVILGLELERKFDKDLDEQGDVAIYNQAP